MKAEVFKRWVGAATVAVVLGIGMMWGCGDNNPSGGGGGDDGGGGGGNGDLCAGFVDGTARTHHGVSKKQFCDARDGKKYVYVTIGSQTWMAENLNYEVANGTDSWCYRDSVSYCNTYGRLYDWNTAMASAASSIANPSGVRGVCPDGWHLPSNAEWDTLMTAVGGTSTAGTKLKSTTGWNPFSGIPLGTDNYGFSALPGGERTLNASFRFIGSWSSWWAATQDDASKSYIRSMDYMGEGVARVRYEKDYGFSVRCVKNVNQVTVSFVTSGTSCSPQTVTAGTSISLPTTTRSGYTFSGWYTASSGGTRVGGAGSSYTASSTVTLYAQWSSSGGGNTASFTLYGSEIGFGAPQYRYTIMTYSMNNPVTVTVYGTTTTLNMQNNREWIFTLSDPSVTVTYSPSNLLRYETMGSGIATFWNR